MPGMVGERETTRAEATTIMIVDAYSHSREGLGASLRAAGFRVETAGSAWQAITKMKDQQIALATIDMDFPPGAAEAVWGWDLVRIFRAFHPAAPVILVATERWRPAGETVVGVEFIEKPIDPRAVRALVSMLCDTRVRKAR